MAKRGFACGPVRIRQFILHRFSPHEFLPCVKMQDRFCGSEIRDTSLAGINLQLAHTQPPRKRETQIALLRINFCPTPFVGVQTLR